MSNRVWRFLAVLTVLAAMVFLAVVGGRCVFDRIRESGQAPSGEISASSLEAALIELYLRFRQGDIERPASDDPTPVTFVVEPGETAGTIAARLEQLGLVSDGELFRLYIRHRGLDAHLEAGEYQLRANMTMAEIAEALQHGRPEETVVTIPEGWRMEQIAEMLSERTSIDGDEFLALAREGTFERDFLRDRPEGASLEGYLFPDTYRLPAQPSALDLIERMLDNFGRRFTPEMRQAAAERGMTIHEVVTLASIVEREAVIPEERPLIASVFLNRLAKGMTLDADPTVQYALGRQGEAWWKKPLLYQDLEVDSPYNTYKNAGLPPGPICNPGLDSIQAVLWPAETDYLYFVATGDGSHAFAETMEEHLRNQERYQQ